MSPLLMDVQVSQVSDEGDAAGAALVRRLFQPWPVVTRVARLPAIAPVIPAAEAGIVAHAVLRRRVEFAVGRQCARAALTELGVPDFVLLNDAERAPRWPAGVVGTLTHTGPVPGGFCAAAVARDTDVRAVGLDAELIEPLAEMVWSSVLTVEESARLGDAMGFARPLVDPGVRAKLIFSAKETFYKAYFPLARQWLDFHDVEVTLDPHAETFTARLVNSSRSPEPFASARGRFAVASDDLLVTALAVGR